MLLRYSALSFALAAWALSAPVFAQEADGDIVVTGRAEDPPAQAIEVQRQARAISRAENIRELPLGIFQKPVCPGIMGLPVEYAELVVGRIRQVIEHAGIRMADTDQCSPNLIVIFTRDGHAQLESMDGKGNGPLSLITLDERRELMNEPGPVHAFSVTSVRTRDGVSLRGIEDEGEIPLAWVQSGNSLILLRTRLDIDASVVMIDLPATEGLSVIQLADYAAMRGLLQTRPPEGDADYDTILTLFNPGGSKPENMTTFDVAFLRSAYGDVPNIPAIAKLSGVKRQMRLEDERRAARAAARDAEAGAEE